MFSFYCIFLIFVAKFCTGDFRKNSSCDLPIWIADSPGFKDPKQVNSVQTGHGTIYENDPNSKGWLIFLNEKKGHGIEVELNKLRLETDSDFLMIADWPLTTGFKQVKLFTGNNGQTLKIRIPNRKAFIVLYNIDSSQSSVSREMSLRYRRYGISSEVDPPTTESPVKKNTVFEVQLKGRPPKDYSEAHFLQKLKEAMRDIASRFSLAHNISFNKDIPPQEMVRIHRVSFCPIEWPERDICASIEHSIYVSGVVLLQDQLIMDFELTAEHLRDMWGEENFPELEELGITVFVLPGTGNAILWWMLITGLIIIGSLSASFIFWKAEKRVERTGPRKSSIIFEAKKKRPKMKLGKLQRIPSFMYDSNKLKIPLEKHEELSWGGIKEEAPNKPKFKNILESESSSQLPIKNYCGSFLFGSNTAFEDDEGNEINKK